MRTATLIRYPSNLASDSSPSFNKRAQVCCQLAEDFVQSGDYEAAREALGELWPDVSERPVLEELDQRTAAEVLLRAGSLSGWIGGTQQIAGAKESAQSLLGGSIAIFEMLGETIRALEAKIELAYCHYRNGAFDYARSILSHVLKHLPEAETNLRAIALMRSATIERHAARMNDALLLLTDAAPIVTASTNLSIKGRFHMELATTLMNLGIAEPSSDYIDRALVEYATASRYFNEIGHVRYEAAVENNLGFLLVSLGKLSEAREHLERARQIFVRLEDNVHVAQVDETRARLALAEKRYAEAEPIVRAAIETLEHSDQHALLAETLTTYGLVLSRTNRHAQARIMLERARQSAERCGDFEGAGRAMLTLVEEQCDLFSDDDLHEVWARVSHLLTNSTHPETLARLCACEDRVAAAHAEHERRRAHAAQVEKLAALGELAFGVAHNVNNALAGILGRAHMMQRITESAKISSGLETIIKAAQDGTQTIKRIQDFARQRHAYDLVRVAVKPLLEDVREFTRPRWEERAPGAKILFELDAQFDNLTVMGNAPELREVLVNMIYNAVHAMPEGGRITLAAKESANAKSIAITISDTGSGMSDEVRTRVFDPFFTTKGMNGTGMGLSVSYGIITRHKGTIEVESELEHGTTFRITLPIAPPLEVASSEAATSNPTHVAGENSSGSTKSIKILVVDDEACIRELLRDALEYEGYKVVSAADGQEALQLLVTNDFDGVFTDVRMPKMNGWELARAMRKRNPRMPMVMLTGWGEAITPEDEQQADWIISKPFELGRISEIAGEVARLREARS